MRLDRALLVFKKDWIEIRQSRQILLPLILVPMIMVVLLPVATIQIPVLLSPSSGQQASTIFSLPPELSNLAPGMSGRASYVYTMSTVFFAPFTLLVPLIVSSIISSDSFAGEKERKTVEALLATPISDRELLMGKILASFIPATVATLISFAAYALITDMLDWPLFGYPILPTLAWLVIVALLAPGFALAAIGLTVIVSSRVSGSREAQQLSGLLIIPIVVLVLGQTSGAISAGMGPLLILLACIAVLDYAVLMVGVKLFNRERILSKL